jgi:hypothetical protein
MNATRRLKIEMLGRVEFTVYLSKAMGERRVRCPSRLYTGYGDGEMHEGDRTRSAMFGRF